MKLTRFRTNDNPSPRLGIITDNGITEVNQSLSQVISNGANDFDVLSSNIHSPDDIIYLPCVENPEKIVCIGLNYKTHAEESKMDLPDYPVIFSKFNNSLAGHRQAVTLPSGVTKFDYEAELGVVIGKETRNVSIDDALSYVFGYCCTNDLSVRDLQFRTSQWILGKTPDSFFPTGPYLVTADEIPDPQNLTIACSVNGEIRQQGNTSDMIFTIAQIISYISQYITLKPGDIIATGTPEGVIFGMDEPVWLKSGDTVTVEIENLGKLENQLV